jgi:HK97 family phage portal protein
MSIMNWFKKAGATARAMTLYLPLSQNSGTQARYESFAREGYSKNSVVYACIREIAEASAGVPWTLHHRLPNGDKKEIGEHPLLRLVGRPNPLQGQFEFIETAMAYLYLAGNCYLEFTGPGRVDEAPTSPPGEMHLLRPDRMTVLADPVNIVGGYEYRVGGETVRFAPERILHLKLFNPLNDWYGLSPVQVASLAINKMNAGDLWNTALLQNAAVPSGALVAKQRLTDEQFKHLEKEMIDRFQGPRNAHKPLLLEGDLDWKEIGITPKDMDWIEGLKLSALQIAQVYNVPPELIGIGSATYQNRKEARKALYTEVVLPALRRLRDALNNSLVPRFGGDLVLDIDTDRVEALSEDLNSLWERANKTAFLTVNEKRALIGYGPLPGGDAPPATGHAPSANADPAGHGKISF